jgi:hypothetical protein
VTKSDRRSGGFSLTPCLPRGRNGGRPKGLLPAYQEIAESVKELYDAEKQSTTQIMKTFKIGSRRTFYKILTFAGVQVKGFTKKRGRKKLNS